MEYNNTIACSQGAQMVFYNACKKCNTMNINYAAEGVGEAGNPILRFKCRGCGRNYKMYAYIKDGDSFRGYRNKHARTSIVRYERMEKLGIVLDSKTVAILTLSDQPVYVPTSEVEMVENIRKYTGYNPPELIKDAHTMFNYGLFISWAKCPECSKTLLANSVKKVMSPLCVETFTCDKCNKQIRRRRYYNLKDGFGWGYPMAVRANKSRILYFGIRWAGGYLVEAEGITRMVTDKHVTFERQRD